ncbi:ERV1/ALR-related protein [Jannaschia formosa]|uniref:ERV1/ALR-related protein n=1 Tax=Jannaschia formosa TaxID=2259592 RepID=UPI00142F7716|nr:ERV1/ALR-related protein [Jannaschia formosa]
MTALSDQAALDALWTEWQARPKDDPEADLRTLLAEGGTRLSERELRFALAGATVDELTREGFADRMVPLLGGPELKVAHAFGHLSPGGGTVGTEALKRVLLTFLDDEARLDTMLEEMDRDGDRVLSLADWQAFFPQDAPALPDAYRAAAVPPGRVAAGGGATPKPAPVPAETDVPPFTATSPLQLQIGFFRLLQGAAYRSFRESWSANAETHLRARDLPYTIPDFDTFVSAAVDLYLALDVVEGEGAQAEFRRLAALVSDEVARLRERISRWGEIETTPEMRAAEGRLDAERAALGSARALFAECVEYILALRLHGIAPEDAAPDSLSRHELGRLRHAEIAAEHAEGDAGDAPVGAGYLDNWNPVLVEGGARPDGAIMPVRFWYEEFMPQLLRCASVMSDADLAATEPDEAALDRWHAETAETGAFEPFATDLRDGFASCTPEVKLVLRQAWRLTEHYLNGLEKRREREEFGRGSGFLSQYVAFVDAWLGRSDIAEAGMRVSFPYYIGPAVWCLLHSAAERIEGLDDAGRAKAIEAFKRFFRAFATMYPCPYCRHHLNRYVVRNSETDRYPVEFLLLGQQEGNPPLQISLDDRLTEISADRPGSVRRFVWKLHNAVSSSIQRTEPWYHREDRPIYTTRFWPGLDAEVARAKALGQDAIAVPRLAGILEVLHPATRLATLRAELQLALASGDETEITRIAKAAKDEIAALDDAVERSCFLQRSYGYDRTRTEAPPHFSPEEEMFARSGRFTER